MASVEELRQQIAQARKEVEEADRRRDAIAREIVEAHQRQQLRRELEEIRTTRDRRRLQNSFQDQYRAEIDRDFDGDHMHGPSLVPTLTKQRVSPRDGKINVTTSISKGEYIWRLQGMSWLPNALAENLEETVESDDIRIGNSVFDLVYAPTRVCIDYKKKQIGSLAIRHREEGGIILRYKFYIKQVGGDFVQWGAEGDECHPYWPAKGKAFGPDVQNSPVGSAELTRPFGVFGLTHEALVKSEWVEDDTLTVKVQIEVMEDSNTATEALTPDVVVPPHSLATDLLSMLEDGKHADTTFIIAGQQIKAHSFMLASRSEVFDRELHGSMRESLSKVIEITDVDFATFKLFLHFLYTDDLDRIEDLIKDQVNAETSETLAAISSDLTSPAISRTFTLQNILAVSHKYQVQRLRLWCEQQLCTYICKDQVCSIICQAHMYDAKQLEKTCLSFIKSNMDSVMATSGFGSLSAEWPAVMLKINIFLAGLSENRASEAIAAHSESRHKRVVQQSEEEVTTGSEKRARAE